MEEVFLFLTILIASESGMSFIEVFDDRVIMLKDWLQKGDIQVSEAAAFEDGSQKC